MKNSSAQVSPRAAATRAALLDALESQVAAVGFDRVTSTSVAATAAVSTGSFYAYFADKHEALAELFARRLDDLVTAVEAVLTADNLLDLGLDGTMSAAVTRVVEHYRGHTAAFRAALGRIPADVRLRGVYWDGHDRAVEVVERFIRRGVAAGMIRDDQSVDVLAHTLLVLTQSLHHPVVIAPQQPDLVSPLCTEVANALTNLLSGGSGR